MRSTKHELHAIENLAKKLAIKAGDYLSKAQSQTRVVEYKDAQDISTTADLESEHIILSGIHSIYPEHSIYSEEKGDNNVKNPYRWIIDPLDGTKEFVRGIPQFNVSIAVEYNDQLVVAVIYRPSDHALYSAIAGEGSYLNGKRINVASTKSLKEAFVYCYLPSYFRNPKEYKESWAQLGKVGEIAYRIRSFADENAILCWLAQGGHEAYINLSNPPKWHDIAPGLLIAQEAGAYIPNQAISQIRQGTCNSIIIANQATIWQEIKQIIDKE